MAQNVKAHWMKNLNSCLLHWANKNIFLLRLVSRTDNGIILTYSFLVMLVHVCSANKRLRSVFYCFLLKKIKKNLPAGCNPQTRTPATAAERHQRCPEESAAPHAHKPPTGETEGQTLLPPILQSPYVLWFPKPYDAWFKQVSSHGPLSFPHIFCCHYFWARNLHLHVPE